MFVSLLQLNCIIIIIIVCNIGHFDNEIAMEDLENFPGIKVENIKPQVDQSGHGVPCVRDQAAALGSYLDLLLEYADPVGSAFEKISLATFLR